ncbi:MAG TPA: thiamine phosphate synthase [Dehalococcoidia bacterium]|nr:thiamine phosphate synthase [Dehalococcoidia bacterium]
MAKIAGLYVIIDPAACRGREPVAVGLDALAGGASVIQWRDKLRDKGEQLADAAALFGACQQYDAVFIVNDDADLALVLAGDTQPEFGAIGVHVGQTDLPLESLWRIVPDYFIVGASTNNVDEAIAAEAAGADYVAVGDIFGTAAKQGTRPASPDRLREVRDAVGLPVVGIGGITKDNAGKVIAAGADAVAVLSAVCAADNPERVARELVAAIRAAVSARQKGPDGRD